MPNPKQMDKLARKAASRRDHAIPDPAPGDPMPDQLWDALLDDPRAATKPTKPTQQCRLSDIRQHLLRFECQRCLRIVEIQTADALRFYGPNAFWKDVGQRLLDQTCTNRTGPARGGWMLAGMEPLNHALSTSISQPN
jgi:hypothetical protein